MKIVSHDFRRVNAAVAAAFFVLTRPFVRADRGNISWQARVKLLSIAPITLAGCDKMASMISVAMEMRDHAAARIHDPSSHRSAEGAKWPMNVSVELCNCCRCLPIGSHLADPGSENFASGLTIALREQSKSINSDCKHDISWVKGV
jgi:hypothetical protein